MRVVLVTYQFPPTGGAGVGRALKLCKFLPEHGVDVTVLTVSNPSVPVVDASLARDVPSQTRVVRVPSLEPGYAFKNAVGRGAEAGTEASGGAEPAATQIKRRLKSTVGALARSLLVPDPQILWQPGASLGLLRSLSQGASAVLITAPPFSQFLLAPLAQLRGVPVVLDYRDEWSTYRTTYENSGAVSRRVGEILEASLLRRADAVVVATEGFRDNLLARFPFLGPERVVAIPNGYDPDDLPELAAFEPPADKLTITYAGTIFRLTRPRGFLDALRRLRENRPDLARHLRVRFVGRIVASEASAFEGLDDAGVELLGYVDKRRAVELCASSHMTLCILDDLPENRRIYPAKVFELMALGRPCLTLAPPGALADLATAHQMGPVCEPGDVAAIEATVVEAVEDFIAGRFRATSQARDVERFHRSYIAGEFARVLRGVTERNAAEATS